MCRLRTGGVSLKRGTELRWFCCSLGLDVAEVPPLFIAEVEQLWERSALGAAPGLLGFAASGEEREFPSLGTVIT